MLVVHLVAALASASTSSPATVTPSSVLAMRGSAVQVAVQGFGPSANVTIALDSAQLATAATNAAGRLTFAVRIPPDAGLGDHELVATDAHGAVAQSPFVVVGPLRGRVVNVAFHSRALHGTMHASVYVPPGYANAGARYPTLYFLHGLPAGGGAYLQRALPIARLVEAVGKPAIVVIPQGARDGDSDPEYADWGAGRNWEHAVAVETPAYVDRHFRTIRDRDARGIVGVSAGGYGATICALHHLVNFSVIESWSGYFRPTDPTGTYVIDRGSPEADSAASVFAAVPRLAIAFAMKPTYFSFYVGDADSKFRTDNVELDAQLTAAGVTHEFHMYPGRHNWALWDTHAEQWLGAAIGHLAAPTTGGHP